MKLGLIFEPWNGAAPLPIPLIQHAEKVGFDSVWTSETYGADAMTQLAFIAAHTSKIRLGTSVAQLDARTPANLAMCAQSIEALAGHGRMILGIGLSGPQIVEGWYGRPWGRPNPRLRDAVAIIRQIFRREGYVSIEGKEISLPYRGEGSSGLGKPLKSLMAPTPHIPILLGTHTPLNTKLTGEIADGWLGGSHVLPSTLAHYKAQLAEGAAKRLDGKTVEDLDLVGSVGVVAGDDVKAALQTPKANIALYVGGMGAKGKNFHKESMAAQGYSEAADRIQELFLAGRKDEAAAAVPDDYVDERWLVGPLDRIARRFRPWADSDFTTMLVRMTTPEVLETLAKVAAG